MTLTRDQLLLLGAAGVLRLTVFVAFPSIQALLTHRVEISTPVTSFKRCITSCNFDAARPMADLYKYKRGCICTPMGFLPMMEASTTRSAVMEIVQKVNID